MTPIQAYTGRIPLMDNLITFGAKITAKHPGTRPSTTHPWTYDGIFLGYGKTTDNIKYFDIHTGTDKTARHDSKDELQYGDDPLNRSPAASHLLSVFSEDDHKAHTTNNNPETIPMTLTNTNSRSPATLIKDIIHDSPPSYTAAAAAKVSAHHILRTKFERP
ncbi:unnamed protein product [Pseudo-nitzschia multistriata]|uniref:Uncharacterized protein n=1 Tax=Pseudo-nitzschia multistriata TaxID=183589 RepID=A0A448Z360_9STRA|nr:unnamed protein product [Pseudo-nitzschia multistriata]